MLLQAILKTASFLAGKRVASAGELFVYKGVISAISAKTGHYKIDPNLNQQFLQELKELGVDISQVVDHGKDGIK